MDSSLLLNLLYQIASDNRGRVHFRREKQWRINGSRRQIFCQIRGGGFAEVGSDIEGEKVSVVSWGGGDLQVN